MTWEKLMHMVTIEKGGYYDEMTMEIISQHVGDIKRLDEQGKLEICGVFKDYPGMAGLYFLKTESREEAEELCKMEPLVTNGYAAYI